MDLPNIDYQVFGMIIMSVVALLTLYSLYDYILGFIENYRLNND